MTPRSRLLFVVLSAATLVAPGCTVRDGTDAGAMDAGRDAPRPDVPLIDLGTALDLGMADAPDTGSDAPSDTPFDVPADTALDTGVDAPGRDAPSVDAPAPLPVIDGVLMAGEWSAALTSTDLTPTIWAGNELRGLRVLLAGGWLYLALEGRVEGGNAMAVYVDRDLDEAVGISSLASLTDDVGALDAAITAALITPATFRTDLVFGTLDLSRSASGADPRMGWRDLNRAASLADLYWISADLAPMACSASACETRLPLSELGGVAPRRLGLFARIVNADGSMSPNQTLPADNPSMPRTVSMILELDE